MTMKLDSKDFKAILFDFNGTMYDDRDINILGWDILIRSMSKEPIEDMNEWIKGFNTHQNKYYAYDVLNKLGLPCDQKTIEETWIKKESIYLELAKQRQMYSLWDGLDEFLDNLVDKKIPFNIASLAPRMNFDFYFSQLGLGKWFNENTIVCDEKEEYSGKIAMYKEAAKRIAVDIKDCIIFEDSISSINNAIDAGCVGVIVQDRPHNHDFNHEKIIGRISDFKEITIL